MFSRASSGRFSIISVRFWWWGYAVHRICNGLREETTALSVAMTVGYPIWPAIVAQRPQHVEEVVRPCHRDVGQPELFLDLPFAAGRHVRR